MDALVAAYEGAAWTTPFYKAITHGVYMAHYDVVIDPRTGRVTKQGAEFLTKKKIKAAFVCHAAGGTAASDAASPAELVYVDRESTESAEAVEVWVVESVAERAAGVLGTKEGNVAVLSVAPNGLACAAVSGILMRCRGLTLAQALTTLCQAVGGGAIADDLLHQTVIFNLAKRLGADTALPPSAHTPLRLTVDTINNSHQQRLELF